MLFFNTLFVIFLIVASGILSAIETSIASTPSEQMIQNNPKLNQEKIKQIKELLAQKEKIITAVLISFTILSTIAITITTSILTEIFGKDKGQTISSILMSVSLVVFSEILPKIIAVSKAESIILRTTKIMEILLILFLPCNYLINYITPIIDKIFSIKKNKNGN